MRFGARAVTTTVVGYQRVRRSNSSSERPRDFEHELRNGHLERPCCAAFYQAMAVHPAESADQVACAVVLEKLSVNYLWSMLSVCLWSDNVVLFVSPVLYWL
jgi:hypothetical protein